MKSLSAKTFQCGVTVQGLTTLSGTVYLTALTNTATWDYIIVGTSAQGQLYTRTYAQLMSDVSSGITLSLDGLSDVVAPTPSTGQLLRYNGIQWANWTPTFYSLPAGGTTLQYIDGTGAFQTFPTSLPASSVKHQVKAGVAINKGQAVYVTSADGTNMIVGLASNASEATSSKTMGLLDATVTTNGFANVVTEGLLAGLDTSTAGTEGDPVWLGTGGNLIYGLANKPSAPAHLVFIGIVTRKNASNGEIFVKVQNGFELNEIHDVDIKTTVPVNGHILGFDGTLWVNKTIAGWLGYTPANASGTTNYISKFTGSTTLGNSQIFDNGTNVGIGTSSPAYKLDINGTAVVRSGTLNLVDYYLGISGTCADVNIFNNCGSSGNVSFSLGGNKYLNIFQVVGSSSGYTSGTHNTISSSITYAWSSGTANSNLFVLSPTINNTGTYSGIFRGFYYNPTLTSLTGTTHRGMEIASGDFIWGGGYSQYYGDSIEGFVQFQSSGNSTKIWIRPSGSQGAFNNNYWAYLENSGYTTTLKAGQYHDLSLAADTIRFKNQYLSEVARFVGSSGNLLLGTTTDSGYKLDVVGTARIKGNVDITTSGGTNVLLAYSSYVQAWQSFYVSQGGGAHNFAVSNASSGGNAYFNNVNVGIGTISPTSILDASVSSGATSGFRFKGWSDASTPYLLSLGTQTYQDIFQIKSVNGLVTMGIVGAVGSTPDLAFQTNSTERMRITSAGNVGIGTTSPSSLLNVVATGSAPAALTVQDGARKVKIGRDQIEVTDLSDAVSTMYLQPNANLVINANSGNVGIGTQPSQKLDVNGYAKFTSGIILDGGATSHYREFIWNTSGFNRWDLYVHGAEPGSNVGGDLFLARYADNGAYLANAVTFQRSTGNVGIGTTSPSYKLQVNADGAGLYVLGANTAPYTQTIASFVYGGNSNSINIENQAGKASIQARAGGSTMDLLLNPVSGNVGIGTGSPAAKLDVNGSIYAVGDITIRQSGSSSLSLYRANSGYQAVTHYWEGSGLYWAAGMGYNTYNWVINDTNYGVNNKFVVTQGSTWGVGIGASEPLARLHVGANLSDLSSHTFPNTGAIIASIGVDQTAARTNVLSLLRDGTSGVVYGGLAAFDMSRWQSDGVSTRVQLDLRLSNTDTADIVDVMSWRSNGNVGIGTTSPSQLLHVAGNIRITGAFYDSNNQAGSAGQILKSTGTGTDWVSLSEITGVDGSGTANYVTKWSDADTVTNSLIYDNGTNVGIGTTSPGYNFDVNGQVRVQDKLRVGTVNSGNGVVHMSSSATINPNTTTIVWAQNVSVGMCAFIEYYILNNNSLTDQRAGTIMVTWNQSGTPTIAHTETTTPDIGSTTSINFTSSLVGSDARINAVNSSANPYTIVMSYKYF